MKKDILLQYLWFKDERHFKLIFWENIEDFFDANKNDNLEKFLSLWLKNILK